MGVRSTSTARKGILDQGLAQGYRGYGGKIGEGQRVRQEQRERGKEEDHKLTHVVEGALFSQHHSG